MYFLNKIAEISNVASTYMNHHKFINLLLLQRFTVCLQELPHWCGKGNVKPYWVIYNPYKYVFFTLEAFECYYKFPCLIAALL